MLKKMNTEIAKRWNLSWMWKGPTAQLIKIPVSPKPKAMPVRKPSVK